MVYFQLLHQAALKFQYLPELQSSNRGIKKKQSEENAEYGTSFSTKLKISHLPQVAENITDSA